MQSTHSLQTVSRMSMQVAIVAAVAAIGIALGRWGIPESDSSPSVTVVSSDATHGGWSDATAERKLAQMDAAEQHHRSVSTAENSQTDVSSGTTTAPVRSSPAERKLMDIY